jgi:hypothetical protein
MGRSRKCEARNDRGRNALNPTNGNQPCVGMDRIPQPVCLVYDAALDPDAETPNQLADAMDATHGSLATSPSLDPSRSKMEISGM